jgi:hypothetical protein
MGIWQGVVMDFLKFHLGPPCPTFLRPVGGPPLKRPYSSYRSSPTAWGRPAAILCPFGHPMPYTYELLKRRGARRETKNRLETYFLFPISVTELTIVCKSGITQKWGHVYERWQISGMFKRYVKILENSWIFYFIKGINLKKYIFTRRFRIIGHLF